MTENSDSKAKSSSSISPIKKSPKKVEYAFGTPSHYHHAYSEFSHIKDNSKNFAIDLAIGNDQKDYDEFQDASSLRRSMGERLLKKSNNEYIKKVKKNKKNSLTKRKSGNKKNEEDEDDEDIEEDEEDEEEEEEEKDDEYSNASSLQICTRIPCQQVIRAIAELQLKNKTERIELEENIAKGQHEIGVLARDLSNIENNLATLTELNNSLVSKYESLELKLESLEKEKEDQINEKNELNSKIMILELEYQKRMREYEKVNKSLIDVKWKKKKEMQIHNSKSGLSFVPSEILDQKIVPSSNQTPANSTSSSFNSSTSTINIDNLQSKLENQIIGIDSAKFDKEITSDTNYSILSSLKVRDYIERPPELKTLPIPLQEILYETNRNNNKKLDKYSEKFFEKEIKNSLKSWDELKDFELTSSIITSNLHGVTHSSSTSTLSEKDLIYPDEFTKTKVKYLNKVIEQNNATKKKSEDEDDPTTLSPPSSASLISKATLNQSLKKLNTLSNKALNKKYNSVLQPSLHKSQCISTKEFFQTSKLATKTMKNSSSSNSILQPSLLQLSSTFSTSTLSSSTLNPTNATTLKSMNSYEVSTLTPHRLDLINSIHSLINYTTPAPTEKEIPFVRSCYSPNNLPNNPPYSSQDECKNVRTELVKSRAPDKLSLPPSRALSPHSSLNNARSPLKPSQNSHLQTKASLKKTLSVGEKGMSNEIESFVSSFFSSINNEAELPFNDDEILGKLYDDGIYIAGNFSFTFFYNITI